MFIKMNLFSQVQPLVVDVDDEPIIDAEKACPVYDDYLYIYI